MVRVGFTKLMAVTTTEEDVIDTKDEDTRAPKDAIVDTRAERRRRRRRNIDGVIKERNIAVAKNEIEVIGHHFGDIVVTTAQVVQWVTTPTFQASFHKDHLVYLPSYQIIEFHPTSLPYLDTFPSNPTTLLMYHAIHFLDTLLLIRALPLHLQPQQSLLLLHQRQRHDQQ